LPWPQLSPALSCSSLPLHRRRHQDLLRATSEDSLPGSRNLSGTLCGITLLWKQRARRPAQMRPCTGMRPRFLHTSRELAPHRDDPPAGKSFYLSPAITARCRSHRGSKDLESKTLGCRRVLSPGRKCRQDQQDVSGRAVRALEIGNRLFASKPYRPLR
jgi:hypothetical protein